MIDVTDYVLIAAMSLAWLYVGRSFPGPGLVVL